MSGRGVYIQEVRRVRKEEGTEGVGTHASNLAAVRFKGCSDKYVWTSNERSHTRWLLHRDTG